MNILLAHIALLYLIILIIPYANKRSRSSRLYISPNQSKAFCSIFISPVIEKLDKVSINQKRMSQYISLNYEEHSSTFFNEINRLEPSTYLKLRFNEVCKKYNLSKSFQKI